MASLASCHMLWFLSISAKRGLCVQAYRDTAEGLMGADARGKPFIESVTLRPHVVFATDQAPSADLVRDMHEEAQRECFIANSVITQLMTVPTFEVLS